MADYLLDTGILIRHLRNRPGYRELMYRLAQEGRLYIASFTRLEIVRGMRDHEREATFALLDALRTHPLDAPTADLAGEMIRAWQRKGITLSGPGRRHCRLGHPMRRGSGHHQPPPFPDEGTDGNGGG
jgi:predicted nucleic acid-binding protein